MGFLRLKLVCLLLATLASSGPIVSLAQETLELPEHKTWAQQIREPNPLNSEVASALNKVWIGVATPTAGVGTAGHLFIMFSPEGDENNRFNKSVAYEYSASEFSNLNELASDLELALTRLRGTEKVDEYLYQNRPTALLRLILTNEQTQELLKRLEKDFLFYSENKEQKDYNVLTRNCLTLIYEHLNTVISSPKQKFNYLDTSTFTGKLSSLAAPQSLLLMNSPLFQLKALKEHPLTGEMRVEQPEIFVEHKASIALMNSYSQLLLNCDNQSLELANANASTAIAQREVRESLAFLQHLRRLRNSCSHPSKDELYAATIEINYLLINAFDESGFDTLIRFQEFLK